MLALGQCCIRQILPVEPEQIEGDESRFATPVKQIPELGFTVVIQADNLAIKNGRLEFQFGEKRLFQARNDLNSFPLREMRRHLPCSIRTSERNPSHFTSNK